MVSHIYHLRLDSPIIRLPDVDDLLGKNVEIVIREHDIVDFPSNFETIQRVLSEQANSTFFKQIEDPSTWQKQIRDEWE